ncbi:myb-like protein AA isoform X2 [Anastrepha obliqua]|uniref:myb-like protein AA isoform X2 n=1 Tax=Anastrepha obliqua TaxID=95512 RepID=UPI00240A1005|nr:myb-like protein AA isoform X2 [Anastrepha obliqua]
MNNLTKTEALPKTGHVNEVCKEWLVREDSALAYKLQSQEINDFYKGNRQRNAVVREDFPTALNEQIKEKEQAEKQVEMYRRRLLEQEAHDKRVAKEIADKLERDLQEQRHRELLESEEMAQQMQELYVNLPPPTRGKTHPPPPRPAKASILQQNPNEPSTSNGRYFGSSSSSSSQHSNHQQQQQSSSQSSQISQMPQQQQPSAHQQQHQQQLSPASFLLQQKHFSQTDWYVGITVQKTPSPTTASVVNAADSSFPPTSSTRQQSRSQTIAASGSNSTANGHLLQQHQHQHQHSLSSISTGSAASTSSAAVAAVAGAAVTAVAAVAAGSSSKLSPEKYDQLVGNDGGGRGASNVTAAERHMQAHADDIELYVDPCDYASLKEIGLPMEEIKEMSKKLKQEQKDELLARRLQQMEVNDGLTLEQRDRLLAIEAQDKELAKMLQDRERAKAKRAKEKARLRKHQQKDAVAAAGSTTLCSSSGSSSNGLHCGPLLPLPQDCLSFGKHATHAAAPSTTVTCVSTSKASSGLNEAEEEDIIDVEAYSNPIDVLHSQQQRQHQNGTLTNGSLTREGGRRNNNSQQHNSIGANNNSALNRIDDDIYTLPVDSCRPGQRPASLNISPTGEAQLLQHNSMTRSENYSTDSHDSLSRHELAPRMNYSQSSTFDKSSSPTPPYMPIQGTRRSNSSDDRKKKSKDKCTHQ